MTSSTKDGDLIICGKCQYRWRSKRPGFFGWTCPACGSKAPIMAELNQTALAQGASNSQEKIKQLKRVINAPFETSYHFPPPNLR
ncbi:MAG: hypothetical protein ACRD8W_15465 [Nitrososphaeraceae archaeon]